MASNDIIQTYPQWNINSDCESAWEILEQGESFSWSYFFEQKR